MSILQKIEKSPHWLPNRIDQAGQRIQFVRYDEAALEQSGFLANKQWQAEQVISVDDLLTMRPETGEVRFIFHTGFCRSTLLHHALSKPENITGINEPEILNSLARLRNPDREVIEAVIRKLSHTRQMGRSVLIKPSNFPNRLIPMIMKVRPDTPAILMTNSLREFLLAIVRKGYLGRQWGRQYYLEAANYAGNAAGFRDHIPGMTDLQVAALGWLFMQSWFSSLLEGASGQNLRLMRSESLDKNRRKTLVAANKHLRLNIANEQISEIVRGGVFEQDAKTGEDFQSKSQRDAKRSQSTVVDEEIAQVGKWVSELAQVSQLKVPLKQSPV